MCTIVTSWWAFVYFYALQFPMGIGLVYYTPIVCCWEWFPEKKGLVTGIIVAGFGFGAFFFGFISTAILNPDDLSSNIVPPDSVSMDRLYPEEVALRVPKMFRTCLVIWAILCALSIALVSRNPNAKEQARLKKIEFLQGDEDEPISIKEAVSSKRFLQICAMYMFGTFYGLYIASAYKSSNSKNLTEL
jgi:MFS family permease